MNKLLSEIGEFKHKWLKQQKQKIIKNWKESRLLDGLEGPIPDNIAKLFECCKSSKINYVDNQLNNNKNNI